MDRLPKHKELVFNRARKTLYLQLTTVIRSLGTKFRNTRDQEPIRQLSECLSMDVYSIYALPARDRKVEYYGRIFCVTRDIIDIAHDYRDFLSGKSGDGRSTKKLRAGIKWLEFLRDNWDDLEITGDLKSGYRLELKK